jgi:hypothetical protein
MSHRLFHDFDTLSQPWSCNPNTFALYHHFVYNAVHYADYYSGIWLEEGQLFFGRNEWCRKTGISEQSLRTSINSLKSTNHITIKSTNKGSIITLCNYRKKQEWNYKPNQQTNQQLTSNQPAANQQLTTIYDKEYTSDTSDTSDTKNTASQLACAKNENQDSEHEKIIDYAINNGFGHILGTDSSSIAISLKKGSNADDWIIAMNGISNKLTVKTWYWLSFKAEKNTSNRLAGLPPPATTRSNKHDNQTYQPSPPKRTVAENEIIASLARRRELHGEGTLNFLEKKQLSDWEAIHGKAEWERINGINYLKGHENNEHS